MAVMMMISSVLMAENVLISAWIAPAAYYSKNPVSAARRRAASASSSTSHSQLNALAEEQTFDGVALRDGRPLETTGNVLLVKLKDTLTATQGGILLPDQAKEKPTEGVVVAAGPGRVHPHTAVRMDHPIRPGLSVL